MADEAEQTWEVGPSDGTALKILRIEDREERTTLFGILNPRK